MKNKKYLILSVSAINIFLPLFVGLIIYILSSPSSFVTQCFLKLLNLDSLSLHLSGKTIIRCYLCDGLWSYALVWALYLGLLSIKIKIHRIIISCIISLFFSITLEFLQFQDLVSGTFDWIDIIVYIISISISGIIIFAIKEV